MSSEKLIEDLRLKARRLRRESLLVMKEMNCGWLGGSFSSADFVTALFFYRMKHDPLNPCWEERDRLIMSKAHSCEIVYAALAEAGYMQKDELKTYSHPSSRLQIHVDCRVPGIDCSGGSLGLGLSFAVGAAMGAYIQPNGSNLSAMNRERAARFRVYCILGDGECNEGQVWEAAQNGAHFRLDNLTAIIDHNKFQSTDAVTARMNPISLAEKFRAFGWETKEIDGNDVAVVVDALVAAEVLEKENIHARVLDMHTIKPLDEAAVISAAKDTGAIVTAEDASVIGGLGGAVAELVSEKAPAVVRRVGVNDRFGDSGKTEELKEIFGLTAASICRAVREAIAAKGQEGWKERGLEGEKVRRKEGK